jgi:GST-like protein
LTGFSPGVLRCYRASTLKFQERTMSEQKPKPSLPEGYMPADVWQWDRDKKASFAGNRPIAGATHDKELPVGKHPLQLYSVGSPNGQKVTIMLEELLQKGITGAEYDAWYTGIMDGDQFGSGFVSVNPNSKIPAMMDRSTPKPMRIFESGAILMYLAEKFGAFLPKDPARRTECLSWLFWQVGSTPYLGGGFGHFYAYAPVRIEYAIERFTMEVKRQLDVLDQHLAKHEYMADEYSIADMAIWPWYGAGLTGGIYTAAKFLALDGYKNLARWRDQIAARPGVARGRRVNLVSETDKSLVRERHDAKDLD